jgi:mono/diheme cytochrome c family protein
MKRAVITAIGVAFLSGVSLSAQDPKLVAAGKKLYDAKECAKCHTIAGKGERQSKYSAIDDVGARVSEADIRMWLKDSKKMEAALDHTPKTKMSSKMAQAKLTDADIDALTAYMLTLKTVPKKR